MGFTSIRKKTRGLRNKIKRIDEWKSQSLTLDLDLLKRYERHYVKLWIPPFYNLYTINQYKTGHKNPPNWFNRIILKAMVEVYKNWERTLNSLGEPYYLKIWLYDPDFINSQIVCALGENIDYYSNLFEKNDTILKFPQDKFRIVDIDISDFDWECYKDQYIVFESEFIDDMPYLEYVRRKAYKISEQQILGKNETCYHIKEGRIWVGSLRK